MIGQQQALSPPSTTGHTPNPSAEKPIHCQATMRSPAPIDSSKHYQKHLINLETHMSCSNRQRSSELRRHSVGREQEENAKLMGNTSKLTHLHIVFYLAFKRPNLKTLCVIERGTNHPRGKYHCSHCCFHTVVTCAVLHPGTPCLHNTKSESVLLIKGGGIEDTWMCIVLTAKSSVVPFSLVWVQEMFLQEPQHTWGSADCTYTWC